MLKLGNPVSFGNELSLPWCGFVQRQVWVARDIPKVDLLFLKEAAVVEGS